MTDTVKSMTGFGSHAVERDGLRARVDVRSVNSRQLRLNIRSRPLLGAFEMELRTLVSDTVRRGTVDVNVELTRLAGAGALSVDETAAAAVVDALRGLAARHDLEGELSISDLLQAPGLFDDDMDAPVADGEWPVVRETAAEALERFDAMRRAEGAATAEALIGHAAVIEEFAVFAGERSPLVVERVRERLSERLAELLERVPDSADGQAVEREVVFHADRCDITEEVDRLGSHTAQFRAALDDGGEAGRRLDFLAQEMMREINTIASKGNDTEIATRSVEAKLAVEKIKEQVANVE